MKRIVVFTIITTILMTSLSVSADFPVEGSYVGLDSGIAEPYSQFDDQVTLVEAFATWCIPCQSEFHELSKLNDVYGDNLTLFSLSVEPTDNLEKIEDFKIEAENIFDFSATWEIGLSIIDDDNPSFRSVMKIEIIPTTILIDETGSVAKTWEGVVEASEISSFIDANVTFPESNAARDLLNQITANRFFQIFMVGVAILAIYQILVPKSKPDTVNEI